MTNKCFWIVDGLNQNEGICKREDYLVCWDVVSGSQCDETLLNGRCVLSESKCVPKCEVQDKAGCDAYDHCEWLYEKSYKNSVDCLSKEFYEVPGRCIMRVCSSRYV
jgi:hypothetical protein